MRKLKMQWSLFVIYWNNFEENNSAIAVEANDDERGTLMTIMVATEDMGRLTKSGQTIDALVY